MNLELYFDSYEDFENQIDHIKSYLNAVDPSKKSYIFYALLEAINNAFEHAFFTSDPKDMKLTFHSNQSVLTIEFLHNGATFEYERILTEIGDPERYLENHLMDVRGRGIPIMMQCSDGLTYDLGGRLTQLRFCLE